MKIKPISCNKNSKIQPFDMNKISYGFETLIIKDKSKIKCVTPDYYIKKIFQFKNDKVEKNFMFDDEKSKKYANDMLKGDKFPVLSMHKMKSKKSLKPNIYGLDGLHRAVAAKIIGLKKIPVLNVNESY